MLPRIPSGSSRGSYIAFLIVVSTSSWFTRLGERVSSI